MAVLDASVWISFFLESDIHHSRARELIHSLFQNENQ
jgi:predicted nucleic acid-binding protein